jgi:apolipoprotein D and lipocalin family protein
MPRLTAGAALILVTLSLTACVTKPRASAAFRSADAPIWSAAAFQPSQIAGTWRQAAVFQRDGETCQGGSVEITPEAAGLRLNGALCVAGKLRDVSGLAVPSGPGRLMVGGEEWWVLWVDSGYRTMAIGTPSGQFGFVLDRAALPADRLNAAREVFDFNGYATGALTAL